MFRTLLIVCGLCTCAQVDEPESSSVVAQTEQASPLAWAGPGLYEGQWFDTEEEYHAYLARHDRHDGHHRDRHDDKHRKHHHKDKKKDHHHKDKKRRK